MSTKRKIEDENREFKSEWTDSYAFVQNSRGLPCCMICNEVVSNNKKCNLERHFQKKHSVFAEKYPSGDARKKAVEELKRNLAVSQNRFTKWVKSSGSTTAASFVLTREIIKRGKPFTDGEYIRTMDDTLCAVCFNEFHERDFVPKLLDCSHTFCANCVQELLKSTRECPFCKKKMERTEYPTNLMGLKLMDFCNKSSNDLRFSSLSIQKCLGECEEKKVDVKREMKRLSGELENLKERRDKLVEERKQLDENIDGLKERIEKNQTSSQALESELVKLEQLEEKWKPFDEKRIREAMEEISLQLKNLFPSVNQELKLEDFENETVLKRKVAHRAKGGESILCFKDVKEERWCGKLTLLDGCLLCHSLSPLRGDAIKGVTLVRFEDIAPSHYKGGDSFLLLQSGPDGPQIRIKIRLEPFGRLTSQFAHLCTGERGPSYKGAEVREKTGERSNWGSFFFGVDKYMDDGREGSGAIETLSGGYRGRNFEEVVIFGLDDGSFMMVEVKAYNISWKICAVGVVTSPSLSALESFPWEKEVRVSDCGIYVPV